MKLIMKLCADIAGNIDEARDKIRTAYEIKSQSPEAAAWYKEMASAHLGFNQSGHTAVKKLIDAHRSSETYKQNPAYADGMIAAWEAVHADLTAKAAEVKSMIDGFKS